MSVQRTGNFNVGIYYDENLDKDGNSWYLVVLDKFTPTGTYVGKKTFYFFHFFARIIFFNNCVKLFFRNMYILRT